MATNNMVEFLMKPKNWWIPMTLIFAVSLAGIVAIGFQTYNDAPPRPDFVSQDGVVLISESDVIAGQSVFLKYALMNYGSMFGDGANRGPDFTAEALHQSTLFMREFHLKSATNDVEKLGIETIVKKELKQNNCNTANNRAQLSKSQEYAVGKLSDYYKKFFSGELGSQSFQPHGYIKDQEEIRQLSAFFFWGAWVCGVERPGETYSYTHNWPFDPMAGNTPTAAVIVWSILGSMGLILGLGLALYYYGRLEKLNDDIFLDKSKPFMTKNGVEKFVPTASQRAAYKFFFAAILLFSVQVLAGILTVHDFVGFTTVFGYNLRDILPITITRSWHVQLSVLWIGACWIGASLFVAPLVNPQEPKRQHTYINFIFWLLVLMTAGSVAGIFMGPHGLTGQYWHWLGNQGWEYVELGKIWQGILFVVFVLWAHALYRAVRPVMQWRQPWALPNWLVYSTSAVVILLISGFIATPKTNFVIADFWRWCVIHMWAEAFFEVFTTVLVGYFMVLMGLVSVKAATRVIYMATLLFLGSGLLGISHNFYWNAKPVATMALGSVFSTLQVVPLILLTVEAWRFRKLPRLAQGGKSPDAASEFGFPDIFLFLIGVNFWNFFGAGVFGFIINLPIANYYEHGTYLTVNHGHMALMGVYGNLSLAGVLFCCRLLFQPAAWNLPLMRRAFWSINLGLLLMSLLDLFPAGIHQFDAVVQHGLWHARSAAFIDGNVFQSLTWMRIVGGSIFVVGGVAPLTWFVASRALRLKPIHLGKTPHKHI